MNTVTYTEQIMAAVRRGVEAHFPRINHELTTDPGAGYGFEDPILSVRLAFKSTRRGLVCEWRATVKFGQFEETGTVQLDDPRQAVMNIEQKAAA